MYKTNEKIELEHQPVWATWTEWLIWVQPNGLQGLRAKKKPEVVAESGIESDQFDEQRTICTSEPAGISIKAILGWSAANWLLRRPRLFSRLCSIWPPDSAIFIDRVDWPNITATLSNNIE